LDVTANRNDLTTRYLLGKLSEEERRDVELRFLSDNAFFEQMLAAEDALLDEYLCGTLSEDDQFRARALFDSSGEQRQSVEFTNQFLSLVRINDQTVVPSSVEAKPHKSTPHALALPPAYMSQRTSRVVWGVVALLFVVLGSWSLYLYNRIRTLSAREAAAEQTARQANDTLQAEFARQNQLREELETERKQKEQAEALLAQLQSRGLQSFITVTLRPVHFERSGSSNLETFKIKTPQLKLRLVLESDHAYERYSAVITTFGGRKVRNLSLHANQVQQGMLTITLSTNVLGYDDFKIELLGASANHDFERVADYAFRLAR
jgi:hypothetical protein